MTSETLDRVLQEAFRLNKSLFRSCKITYASTPLHSTTVEALAETLSNVDDHEIMIIKTPQKPLSIVDIKTVFVTMLHECKCCSNDAPDSTVSTYESEDYGDITIRLCSISLPSSPRAFALLHHAVEISNGLMSICPSYCNRCEDMKCDACCNFRICLHCHDIICGECEIVDNCSYCDGFNCSYCGGFACTECDKVACETCANHNGLICDSCYKYKCSDCSKPDVVCSNCNHGPDHWFCDECKVMCTGCNKPYCDVDWEECGYITCGICEKDKCWASCFNYNYIVCGKCKQPICKDCESDVRFCFKCIEFYCYPKCQSFKLCWNCFENNGDYVSYCRECCGDRDECFKCHEMTLIDMIC